jgi:hypothetical protein
MLGMSLHFTALLTGRTGKYGQSTDNIVSRPSLQGDSRMIVVVVVVSVPFVS